MIGIGGTRSGSGLACRLILAGALLLALAAPVAAGTSPAPPSPASAPAGATGLKVPRAVLLGNFDPAAPGVPARLADGTPSRLGTRPPSPRPRPVAADRAPLAGVGLVLDDGSLETNVGFGSGGANHFMFLNRFTPDPANFPFVLTQVQVWWDSGQVSLGDTHRIVVLADPDGDGALSNATVLHEQAITIAAVDGWDVYSLTTPLLLTGPGDVCIGIAQDSDAPYPAAFDESATQGRSFLASWAPDCTSGNHTCPTPILWPPNCDLALIDGFGLPGNWMVRGVGIQPPPPWLAMGPTSFTDDCVYGRHGGDGFADPSETLTFYAPVQNIGFAEATEVVATLSSTYPITGTSALGTIPAGGTQTAAFVFDVPWDAPCGALIPLTITVTATQEPYSWTFASALRVGDWTLGPTQVPLTEAFETWPLAGWTLSSSGIGGWFQGSTGYWANWVGSGDFAEVDTYMVDSGYGSATLTSPPFSLAGTGGEYESAVLQYKTQFYDYYGTENSYVDLSTDGGTSWTHLQTIHDQNFNGWGGPQSVDLSAYIGQSDCLLRFVANSPSAYTIWEIDDLSVLAKYADDCSMEACCDAISVTPATLPPAEAFLPYSQTMSASGGVAPYTYTVTGSTAPPGLTLAPDGTFSGAPTTGGTFEFTVRAADSKGCTGDQLCSLSVTCTEVPPVITGEQEGCVSPGIVLTTAPYAAYQWSRNRVDIPGATSRSYTATASGRYTVRTTDCYGYTGFSEDFQVTLHPNPVPTIAGASTGCVVPGVNLSTQTFVSYQWELDGVPIPGATGPSIVASQTGDYTVVVVDSNGCSGTSAPKSMTLYENPAPTIVGPPTACMTADLSTQVFTTYQWYRNGFTIAGATGQTLSAPAPGTYTVRVTNENGCVTLSAPFTVGADPTPTITGPAVGCASVTLSTGPYAGYQWYLEGAPIPGATAQTYEAVAAGSYTVSVTTSLGCTGTSPAHSVALFQAPAVTGLHINACPDTRVLLAATPGYATYQWRLNGSPLPGATGPSYAASVTGLYSVSVTDGYGCSGSSADHEVFVDFCATSEVSPAGAAFPARLVKDSGSPTGFYLYFQRVDSAEGFNLYEGDLDSWYSHGGAPGNLCGAAVEDLGTGEMRAAVSPSAGEHYYLVTAHGGGVEGPSGFSSLGAEIDPAQSTCTP